MFLLNGIIVLLAGFVFNWESALYTIISIYCLSQVVDMIHTCSHQKVTAMIVTTRPEAVALEVSQQIARGMTLLPSNRRLFRCRRSDDYDGHYSLRALRI